jgi:hypothetical protein
MHLTGGALGASPQLKFSTQMVRLGQSHVQPSLLFFRTSPNSRSAPRFLNETRIIPPLLYTACLHALNDIRKSTDALQVEFADEEGDPYAVELAARLGGYVVGNDSDFVVLNTEGYLGYIPLEEMIWHSPLKEEIPVAEDDHDFQPVHRAKPKKPVSAAGLGRGIIPPEAGAFTLTATAYSPAVLATHLKIPVPLLPLLGALVGNDYTNSGESSSRKTVQQLFFDKRLSLSQRIDRVASTLQTILSPVTQNGRKPKHQIGSVMDLIDKAVHSLLSRLTGVLGSGEIDEVVEKVVEAALQYAIPKEDTSGIWPSSCCILHDPDVCPLLPLLSRKVDAEVSIFDEENEGFRDAVAIRDRYLEAYRGGNLAPKIMGILGSGTFWPRVFLENPDLETVSRSIGRPIREWGYAILHDAVGLHQTPDPDSESDAGQEGSGDEEELVDVVESDSDDGDDLLAPLKGELDRLHGSDASSIQGASAASATSSGLARPSRLPTITEYLRRGTRIAQENVTVHPLRQFLSSISPAENEDPSYNATYLLLRPYEVRLNVFLRALKSDNHLVRALAPEHILPVLTLRWVIYMTHLRADSKERGKEQWTRREAQCFLAAFDWRVSCAHKPGPPPLIVDRYVQLAAQALSTLETLEHFSQVLLLPPGAMPSPAHLFSGRMFHENLTGKYLLPDHTAAAIPDALLEAVSYDLEAAFVEDRQGKKAGKAVKADNARSMQSMEKTRGNGGSQFQLLSDVEA